MPGHRACVCMPAAHAHAHQRAPCMAHLSWRAQAVRKCLTPCIRAHGRAYAYWHHTRHDADTALALVCTGCPRTPGHWNQTCHGAHLPGVYGCPQTFGFTHARSNTCAHNLSMLCTGVHACRDGCALICARPHLRAVSAHSDRCYRTHVRPLSLAPKRANYKLRWPGHVAGCPKPGRTLKTCQARRHVDRKVQISMSRHVLKRGQPNTAHR